MQIFLKERGKSVEIKIQTWYNKSQRRFILQEMGGYYG